MFQRLTAADAAGFANACAYESSDELHRDAVSRWRAQRRWRSGLMAGGATFASLALAMILVVI